MSLTTSEMTPADIRACTCGNDGYNNGGMFGNDWAWIVILLLFGWVEKGLAAALVAALAAMVAVALLALLKQTLQQDSIIPLFSLTSMTLHSVRRVFSRRFAKVSTA